MSDAERVRQYDSQSKAYHDAFQVFLDHTDQKVNARTRLERLDGLTSPAQPLPTAEQDAIRLQRFQSVPVCAYREAHIGKMDQGKGTNGSIDRGTLQMSRFQDNYAMFCFLTDTHYCFVFE